METMNVNVTDHTKNPPEEWYIPVCYQNIDGYHIFTSDAIFGLYIASRNAGKALNQLCPAIERLIEHNHGLKYKAAMPCLLKIMPNGDIPSVVGPPRMEIKWLFSAPHKE